MYSSTWKNRKRTPSATVANIQNTSALRFIFFNAQCAIVIVQPEVSKISVLISGTSNAGTVWNLPPAFAGPLVGHAAWKPG